MPNYAHGKIYALVSDSTNEVYIGSTCEPDLNHRFRNHKYRYEKWLNGLDCYITANTLLQYDDCKIKLIEAFPCKSRKELEKREGEIILTTPHIVNKKLSGVSERDSCMFRFRQKLDLNKPYDGP